MTGGGTYSIIYSDALIMFVRSVLLFTTFCPIITLMYILFRKSVGCSVDDTMTCELWIGKDLKTVFRALTEVLKRYMLEGQRKTMKFLRQNIRCPA
jgi:hypothetical protein